LASFSLTVVNKDILNLFLYFTITNTSSMPSGFNGLPMGSDALGVQYRIPYQHHKTHNILLLEEYNKHQHNRHLRGHFKTGQLISLYRFCFVSVISHSVFWRCWLASGKAQKIRSSNLQFNLPKDLKRSLADLTKYCLRMYSVQCNGINCIEICFTNRPLLNSATIQM